jgi:hypothetical protein
MIAALYVQKNGHYFGLPDVDPWDESRDARLYAGPYPVVAHPPCSRWCHLAWLVEARYGYRRGDDGGTFAAALQAVRTWGGVLEHPASSDAWAAFDLPTPLRHGGWIRGFCGGWACHIEQCRYGHVAKKSTWLYTYGIHDLPMLHWGYDLQWKSSMSWPKHRGSVDPRPRINQKLASQTPIEFRELLLGLARSAQQPVTIPASITAHLVRGRRGPSRSQIDRPLALPAAPPVECSQGVLDF